MIIFVFMALYIEDKEIIKTIQSMSGFGIVCDYIIEREGYRVRVDFQPYTTLIQTYCKGYEGNDSMVSNTVGISPDKIYINPCSGKLGENYIKDLYDFIMDLPQKVIDRRDDRIDSIICSHE